MSDVNWHQHYIYLGLNSGAHFMCRPEEKSKFTIAPIHLLIVHIHTLLFHSVRKKGRVIEVPMSRCSQDGAFNCCHCLCGVSGSCILMLHIDHEGIMKIHAERNAHPAEVLFDGVLTCLV